MKKLLNTLYITQPQSYLSKDGQNIVVSVNQQEVFRIPALNIESIVIFGYMGVSPGLMKLCTDNGIGLCFMTPNGKFISRISGPVHGNVLLRMKQYAINSDKEKSVNLARLFVQAKLHNCRQFLMRNIREHGDNPQINTAQNKLMLLKNSLHSVIDAATIMGMEGQAASIYFGVFDELILNKNSIFRFNVRTRRPPKDPINVLLSFTYTLLTNEIVNALESVGLDPNVGFLHTLRPGRPSLALDMIEEFRPTLCDRFVLSLINKKQLSDKHFSYHRDGVVNITDDGRKILLTSWQNRKKEEIMHPYLKEKVSYGLLPYIQAMLMARYIRGEIDGYPIFLLK